VCIVFISCEFLEFPLRAWAVGLVLVADEVAGILYMVGNLRHNGKIYGLLEFGICTLGETRIG
jgi:hypothetical protein